MKSVVVAAAVDDVDKGEEQEVDSPLKSQLQSAKK